MQICLHGVRHSDVEGRAAIAWAAKEFGTTTIDEAVEKYAIPPCWILAYRKFLVEGKVKGKV